MKVVFAHDHPFLTSSPTDNVYTNGGKFPYGVWERYLNHFDEITVIGRHRLIDEHNESQKHALSSGPRVNFSFAPDISNLNGLIFKKKLVEQHIRAILQQSDALIARLPSEIGLAAIKAARVLKKPYAVEVVACAWDGLWNYGNVQGKVYAPIAYLRNRQSIGKSDFAIYVTDHFLQSRYPNHGYTASCSNVEIPTFEKQILTQRLKRIKEKGEQTITIGLVGSLDTHYKGVDTAIKALGLLKKHESNFVFKVVGRGDPSPYYPLIEQYKLDKNIEFVGALPSGNKIFEFLDTVDIYIQPSKQEGLPRSLIEAMSRGCPAIGSTAGGIPELLDKSCLHRPSDYKKLASLLKYAVQNQSWWDTMAKVNFKKSGNYTKDLLEVKRNSFWSEFYGYVCNP